jgi:hypothetical protein
MQAQSKTTTFGELQARAMKSTSWSFGYGQHGKTYTERSAYLTY